MRIKQFSQTGAVFSLTKRASVTHFFLFRICLVRYNLRIIKHTDQKGLVSEHWPMHTSVWAPWKTGCRIVLSPQKVLKASFKLNYPRANYFLTPFYGLLLLLLYSYKWCHAVCICFRWLVSWTQGSSFFLFIAKWYSIVRIYHSLCSHSLDIWVVFPVFGYYE